MGMGDFLKYISTSDSDRELEAEGKKTAQSEMMRKQALEELAELLGRGRTADISAGQGAQDRASTALADMPMPDARPDGMPMSKGFAIPEDDEAKIYEGLAAQNRSPMAPEQEMGMFRAKNPDMGKAFQEGIESDMRVRRGEADIMKTGADVVRIEDDLKRNVSEPEVAEAEKSAITDWADEYGKEYPAAAELVRTAVKAGDIKTAKEMQKVVVQWMQRVDILNREEENRKRAAERRGQLKDKDREKAEYEWEQRGNLKVRKKTEAGKSDDKEKKRTQVLERIGMIDDLLRQEQGAEEKEILGSLRKKLALSLEK